MKFPTICAFITAGFLLLSCNNQETKGADSTEQKTGGVSLKEDSVSFPMDSITSKSYVVYDQNKNGKRPVVLVVHEWWGLTDYPKSRARQLAEMGYLAMAVDMFGNGRT